MKGKTLLISALLLFTAAAFAQKPKAPPGVPATPTMQQPPPRNVENNPNPFPPATPKATLPPANCSTATGYPCTKSTWNVASCTSTPTFGGPNNSQDSGPCIACVLRCKGSTNVCTAASMPTQTGNPPQVCQGNANWQALIGNMSQTTFSSDPFYDNSGLQYSNVYTYIVTTMYSGSGGGIWSPYSPPFQVAFGQAPQSPPGYTATPAGLVVVTQ
jgi:hypothetical protein